MRTFTHKFTGIDCFAVSTVDTGLFAVDLVGGTRRGRRVPFSSDHTHYFVSTMKIVYSFQ